MEYTIDHIIQDYRASIFKICLGYSKSPEDAEDLFQEVLINIWRGLKSFRNESNIKTWVYRITVNTCLLKQRKKSVKTTSLENVDGLWDLYDRQNNGNQGPLQKLMATIQQLPEKDKLIILLYLEDLTHKEIGVVVGITSNYVGVKINRIKQKLSNKIKTHG